MKPLAILLGWMVWEDQKEKNTAKSVLVYGNFRVLTSLVFRYESSRPVIWRLFYRLVMIGSVLCSGRDCPLRADSGQGFKLRL